MAPPTPGFQTAGLRNVREYIPAVLSHPGCSHLLQQPLETHTVVMDNRLSLSETQFPQQGKEDPPRAGGGARELIPIKRARHTVMADWMLPVATGLIMTWTISKAPS